MTSQELYAKERELKAQAIQSVNDLVKAKGGKVELGEDSFDDDCNNKILFLDEQVNCQNTVYSMTDLSLDDAIYIVSLLEN